ncbi:unnamed protein product, partial [Musa textilis]
LSSSLEAIATSRGSLAKCSLICIKASSHSEVHLKFFGFFKARKKGRHLSPDRDKNRVR